MQWFIYGLFEEDGRCRYIGQTCRLNARRNQHKRAWPTFTLKVQDTADLLDDALAKEIKVAADYRARGEADLYKPNGRPSTGRKLAVYWLKPETIAIISERARAKGFTRSADYLEKVFAPAKQ